MQRSMIRSAAGVVVCGGLGLATVGLGAGVAHALPDGPYTWCPGQTRNAHNPGPGGGPASPGPSVQWDWNVCHTYWIVSWGQGNVGGPDRSIWDGGNPPPPLPRPWSPLPGL
jgi:hypothetical protein